MGEIARATSRDGGRIVGVIPEFMRARELAFEQADELIVTQTMRERKAVMEQRSDAFLVLPGGFGTLEEIMEIITLKQLALHNKPVVFLNENRFFDPLLAFFENFFAQNFARPIDRHLYKTAATLDDAFLHLLNPEPDPTDNLWHVTT